MHLIINELKHIDSTNLTQSIDVILTCLIDKLAVQPTNISGYWTGPDNPSLESNKEADQNFDPEPTHIPVIFADEMYDLDEFYSFLQIDRLVNDANWRELTDYIRMFVANHYQTLKMKQT